MDSQDLQLGLMLLNGLLTRAAAVSERIKSGTLDKAALDELTAADAKARDDQLAALDRARAEGR